ncbi:ligase-associated DNA damage response DEXH box helicase [Rhizomicrobium electricum]|uniref:Ligase-associated DNA damage response DEXH box helicase n=1 Tax=Rhizomicrobium electricum TaxID=480070 RepID=A0ABN1EF29_9PROT|nr:ligase-associated DNA damage response DEXH box helicase [Rhizomicrobium electricum]NIJ48620.1 ATP-dependent Lhr-like helicase [Rhizomicrobium electricum]
MSSALTPSLLPDRFARWFAARGWSPRPHQLQLVEHAARGASVLLVAPTGGGKTLAGFLPSLIELSTLPLRRSRVLHTLYISPLKALAVDVARNLEMPVAEMALDVKIETRTGDTPAGRRQRQRYSPPDTLLTTPEQLALLLSHSDAPRMFGHLRAVVLDELHAIHNSKRGDLLALALARLAKLAPGHRSVGLSATVADPKPLQRYLVPQSGEEALSELVRAKGGAAPQISILASEEYVPWAGHLARHAMADVMAAIKKAKTTLVFVNTRRQAELTFQDLWRINDDNLAIALHHGSLAPEQRRKVEAAMAAGRLKAVVCTSTLDLGIDWGAVDNVVCIGAPKGAARLVQRIGRANHRLDEPSEAMLVPANRFEVLECEAAREAVIAGELDGDRLKTGSLDVLAQHVLGMACAANFFEDDLYAEVISAAPYRDLGREDFSRVVDFVATGGYALKRYDRYAKLRKTPEGQWRLAHPRLAQNYRLNAGTIVEDPMIDIRLQSKGRPIGAGGRVLGQMEEYFIEQLAPGDTFVFAGEVLAFQGIHEDAAFVVRTNDTEAEVPSYNGGKFPLSTFLAQRVREIVSQPDRWGLLPDPVQEWLRIQEWRSIVPQPGQLLVEMFPRGKRFYLVCYPFEGRLAHQTLGMLVTRRLERLRLQPTGFSANEYALAVWGRRDLSGVNLPALFDEDMLGDDLDAWLAESNLYKRTFKNCAVIAGLIERRSPLKEKTGRQVTFSTDLIYDVLREHEPDHILLRATYQDAATGLLDVARLGDMLKRVRGRIVSRKLDRVSPLAVPALLEISKEMVAGEAAEEALRETEESLIADAMRME